jgi:hypothetical protein
MRGQLSRRVVTLWAAAATLGACGGGEQTAPVTTGIALHFCSSSTPMWLAYQDDAGAWKRSVPDASGIFRAAINNRGGIALVRRSSSTGIFTTYVEYATAAELTSEYSTCTQQAVTGSKSLQGSIAGLGASEAAQISLGGVVSTVVTNFSMAGVADGPLDLVATRLPNRPLPFGPPTGLIIRRALNLPTGSVMPVLDFSSAEAFTPASFDLTIGNLGSDAVSVGVSFLTNNQTYATLFEDTAATVANRSYFGIPASQLIAGDLHDVQLIAGTSSSARFFETFTHALTDQTLTLGPELAAPTITVADSAPVIRPRIQSLIQPEYNSLLEINYCQGGPCQLVDRIATVVMTAAYLGSSATSWDATVPDLSKVDGFSAVWGLQAGAGVLWDADIAGGLVISDLVGQPHDGLTFRDAARVGAVPSQIVGMSPLARPSLILDVKRARSQREHFAGRQ